MKRTLFLCGSLLVVMVMTSAIIEEGCSADGNFVTGTKFVWTTYDSTQSRPATREFVVKAVTVTDEVVAFEMQTINNGHDGVEKDPVSTKWECNKGNFIIDTRFWVMEGTTTASGGKLKESYSGDPLIYPKDMKVGDTLTNASANKTTKMILDSPMPMPPTLMSSITINWNDRICDSIQSITTPAGTWTCYRIKYKLTVTLKTEQGKESIPSMNCIEWFSPKAGIVRSEMYENGKLKSSSELTLFTIPK